MQQRLNCAIYTRKSTEEGLEMAFNSLDAQREACEAYIGSQKLEGWRVVPTLYDDGGFSGGNIERPGLKQLMADIEAGKIQIVVVYKVDRLTRSLADFAKIVELFDSKGVSFVSVTQQFNTTSSMGRLTLNVLLSFAQFEREVTGERIRDKIAASKRKGMWMGGVVPLGYRVENRQLHIVPMDSEKVKILYNEYLRLGNVQALQDSVGTSLTGRKLFRGVLYALLQNPIYIGKIRHKDQIYEGQHEAIIEEDLWQQVQNKLASNRVVRRNKVQANNLLLSGMVFDTQSNQLTTVATTKNGRRYTYYISTDKRYPKLRIPAGELERIVTQETENIQDISKIIISSDSINIHLSDGDKKKVPYQFIESGPFRHMQTGDDGTRTDAQKEVLRRLVIQGLKWKQRLFDENNMSVAKLASEENTDSKYLVKVIGAVMISPSVIADILNGTHQEHMTTKMFLNNGNPAF